MILCFTAIPWTPEPRRVPPQSYASAATNDTRRKITASFWFTFFLFGPEIVSDYLRGKFFYGTKDEELSIGTVGVLTLLSIMLLPWLVVQWKLLWIACWIIHIWKFVQLLGPIL